MDEEKIYNGFKLVLEGLGIDLNSPHFKETPERITRAYANELFIGLKKKKFKLTTFPLDEKSEPGMVVLQHIPVKSMCAHHLLPFVGEATVAYIPNHLLCGLSKLSRVVNFFSRKPQVQETLTSEIAQFLNNSLNPKGVGVIIKASHLCMEMRGVDHKGLMTTSSLLGCFLKNPTRAEFMELAHARNGNLS